MFLDLARYIVLGVLQVVTAIWGGIVSARALPEKESSYHVWTFAALGLIGTVLIFATGWSNYRSQRQAANEQKIGQKVEDTNDKLTQSLVAQSYIQSQLNVPAVPNSQHEFLISEKEQQ